MLIAQRMVQITFSYNILLRYRVLSYVCTFFHSNRNSLSSLIYLRADAKKVFYDCSQDEDPLLNGVPDNFCLKCPQWFVCTNQWAQESNNLFLGRGCGAVGRKVVSKSRRQRFGSDPDDFSDNLFPAKCTKDSNKEAENESV